LSGKEKREGRGGMAEEWNGRETWQKWESRG